MSWLVSQGRSPTCHPKLRLEAVLEFQMMDVLYIGLTLVLFAASLGLVVVCQRLMEG